MEGSINDVFAGSKGGGINKFQPRWIGGIVHLFTTFIEGIDEKRAENLPNLLDPRLP